MSKTGIFGKHPAFGDFIGAGMSKPMQVALEEWMGAVLPRVRDNLGDVWQPFYDIALPLRFWLGEGVLPSALGGPVAGVLVFSHDKVGRRFPLIALIEGAHFPPPTLGTDQRWYDALQAKMLMHDTPETAAELAEMLSLPDGFLPAPFEGGEAGFWAVHTAGAVDEMLANVAATDHRRGAAGRSCWWSAGDASRTATFHATNGWPDAVAFQWLIAGNPADEPAEDPTAVAEVEPEIEEAAPQEAWLVEEDEAEPVVTTNEQFEGEPSIIPVSDPWWSGEGARPVPKALYEPEPEPEDTADTEVDEEDGPQSPFSQKNDTDKETDDALADEAEKD